MALSNTFRRLATATTLVGAMLSAAPANAQASVDIWRAYEEKIKPAVFCIRMTQLYERPVYSALDGSITNGFAESISYGSGMSFEPVDRDGKQEYRILTNNHVISAKRYDGGARLVKVSYALVENRDDRDPSDDIMVVKDIQDPDRDQAILVTRGAPVLPVAQIARLGAMTTLQQGDQIWTTGFPNAMTKTSVDGTVSAADYDDPNVLPYPGKVYAANISIDPGQSGSPVVHPFIGEQGQIEFELVGLVYAKNPSTDQIRLITPIEQGSVTLATEKNIKSKRPSLHTPVDDVVLALLSKDQNSITSLYKIDDYKAVVRQVEGGGYMLRHFRERENVILQNEMLDLYVSVNADGGITLNKIIDTKDGVMIESAVPEDRQDQLNRFVNALVNHFEVQRQFMSRASITASNPEQTRLTEYYQSVVADQANDLSIEAWLVYSQLYRDGVISQQFW